MMIDFSLGRFWALVRKEFILMKRDPGVIIIMAIIPLILVCLAGYAVNLNPKHVPTVVMHFDDSDITHDFMHAMETTGYFSVTGTVQNKREARRMLKTGQALLIMTIPVNFTKDLIRGKQPAILIEDGGVDVFATERALSALPDLKAYFLAHLKQGSLRTDLDNQPLDFRIISHRVYDPEHNTHYNVIPGMIGLVLMLTMLMITSVIAFRDVQGGTLECLLVSPTQPIEIRLAQIASYILIGFVQITFGLLLSYYLFHVPFEGSLWLLFIAAIPYLIAELSLGLTVATFCRTQFQAVQVINMFIAFSIVLTGFIFPTFGMPYWAQCLSQLIPLTHFLQILRGIMLKGNDFSEIWQNLWPLLIYSTFMISLAITRFQRNFN